MSLDFSSAPLAKRPAHKLDALFDPASIAIVGASSDRQKFGNRTVRILRERGFKGAIIPINPKEAEIEGFRAYPRIDAVPEAPDLAILALPAKIMADTVRAACIAGVKALVVFSSGFRETGAEGGRLEAEIVSIADEYGVLLLGPNCQGVANFHNGAVANFSLAMLDEMCSPSGLAIVGQSGLLGTILTNTIALKHGFSPGVLVASGNEAQLGSLEIAAYLAAERPEITSILLHLESIPSIAVLERAAEAATKAGKGLCILKVGRSAAGSKAAASHTGSMPVDDAVFSSACAQLGIRLVDSIEAAGIACAVMVRAQQAPAKGRRIALVSNSGGVAALFADMLSSADLQIGALSDATRTALAPNLPGQEASGFNPADVNVLPYGEPSRYLDVVRAVADDEGVDAILLFLGMQRSNIEVIFEGVAEIQRLSGTPVVACIMGCDPQLTIKMREAGILVGNDTEAAVETLALLTAPPPAVAPAIPAPTGSEVSGGGPVLWQSPWDEAHNQVFAGFGIDILPTFFETDIERAVARAEQIGFPVAVKLFSAAHTHKSDVGGVQLNVGSAAAVREVCTGFRTSFGSAAEGFLIQQMCPVKPVAEVFVGCKRDAVFGDVILLGSGGIFVNEWADAQVIGNPDDPAEIERIIDRLVMRPIFRPLRGRPGADVAALARVVPKLARLFHAMPQSVSVLEFNPVILGAPGEGAFVADWRIDMAGEVK